MEKTQAIRSLVAVIALLAIALIIVVAISLGVGVGGGAGDDRDRSELIEDLDLGFPVTINVGTCADILSTPSFEVGIVEPVPLLALQDDRRPLFSDDREEDRLLDEEDMVLLAKGAESTPPPSVVWRAEEEIDTSLDDLLTDPHVVVVHAGADERGRYIACGQVSEEQVVEAGQMGVPIRQLGNSAFAGIALFQEEERFFGLGDVEMVVRVYLFHGLSAAVGQAGPAASPGAEASPVAATPPAATPEASPAGGPAAASPAEGGEQGQVEVTVESVDIDFNPNEFTIPANTDVTVHLPNNGAVRHTFTVDELGIDVDIPPGEEQTITINAPAGEYTYYCDVPGHRQAGMVGTMIVE